MYLFPSPGPGRGRVAVRIVMANDDDAVDAGHHDANKDDSDGAGGDGNVAKVFCQAWIFFRRPRSK